MFKRNLSFAAALSTVSVLAVTGTASAQAGNPFDCSASTADVGVAGTTLLAPTTANPSLSPCASDSATLDSVSVPSSNPAFEVALGPVHSTTTLSTSQLSGSTIDTEANATTTVKAATISLGGDTVSIGPSAASVDDRCVSNALQTSAGSTLNAITINGTTEPLSGQPQTFSLPGVASINVNQRASSGVSTTETLLKVDLLGAAGGGADIVIGTATAGASSGACAGTSTGSGGGGGGGTGGGGGGGTGGGGSACPGGATWSSGGCVVTGTAIAVPSASSEELVGAQVMSLAAARRRFGRHVSCLNGAGPKFVVVGTKRADRITVRKMRMRVLGLGGNDHITVIGGQRTCVNGGAGNDVIVNKRRNFVTAFGANGKDRITLGNGPALVLGGKGNDRITAGKGKVNLQGNAGNDYLRAGNGPARLNGGNGNDVLIAGTGRAHLNGGRGDNRLTAHGKVAYVQASRSGHSVAFVHRHDARYARRHGVRTVHVL
jgi:Ca2+-binding RTX toxin-like protein